MKTLKQLEEEIRLEAYKLYERSGRIQGRDLENWLEAEKIVMARYFKSGERGESPGISENIKGRSRRGKQSAGSPRAGRKKKAEVQDLG